MKPAVSDKRTSEAVVEELARDPEVRATHVEIDVRASDVRWEPWLPDSVGVEVRNGRAYLDGHVKTEAQRAAVESTVRGLTGVCQVGNLISVQPAAPETT